MKYNALLVFSTLLAAIAVSCSKDEPSSETTSNDSNLAGVNVAVGETSGSFKKLFVLNEGKMGTNNASLDFFRFSDGKYVRNSFELMNPGQVLGLGDVGNDIAFFNDRLWLVINNSGLVEVIDPKNEKHVATVRVPSPRRIAFEGEYAYVTSYSGAYYGGPDRIGAVYKVSARTYETVDSVHVGYQPEGIVFKAGKLYVANSGGFKSDYSYDDRISVIDAGKFEVVDEITAVKNMQDIVAVDNNLWVSTFGDYWMTPSGVWEVDLSTGSTVPQGEGLAGVRYSRCLVQNDGTLYTLENVYGPDYSVIGNNLYAIDTRTGNVKVSALDSSIQVAYGLAVNPDNGDLYIGDAADYLNPGNVHCLDKSMNVKWSAVAGVDPGHLLLW
ncbi:MAG: DUF5074 domain-containing protein [Candidatus Cryptobacteroides sp.]